MGACLGVLRLPKPPILEPSYGGGIGTFFLCPIFGIPVRLSLEPKMADLGRHNERHRLLQALKPSFA